MMVLFICRLASLGLLKQNRTMEARSEVNCLAVGDACMSFRLSVAHVVISNFC
jgi:hypothetical protein